MSTVFHKSCWFQIDAGPEALVVKMSRGEQLQYGITWTEKHAAPEETESKSPLLQFFSLSDVSESWLLPLSY